MTTILLVNDDGVTNGLDFTAFLACFLAGMDTGLACAGCPARRGG